MSKDRIVSSSLPLHIMWFCAVLFFVASGSGCTTSTDPCEGLSCGDGESCVEGECVASPDPCEGVTCGDGEVCDEGECVEDVAGPPHPGIDTDTDGDGLTDDREINGWEIWVDFVGVGASAGEFGGSSAPYVVTSDPLDRDTDDDGLEDFEEFYLRTDPRQVDTDGDALTDLEEVRRWHTNPVSVDSDGDATGPDGDLPPNALFFDGNELSIVGTSPSLADTDGDAKTDLEEFDDPLRDPLLAELPQARVSFEGEVDIRLRVEYAESEGAESKYGSSFSTTNTNSTSQSDTTSTAVEIEGTKSGLAGLAGDSPWEIGSNLVVNSAEGKLIERGGCFFNDLGPTVSEFQFGLLGFDADDPTGVQAAIQDSQSSAFPINCEPTIPDTTTTTSTTFTQESTHAAQTEYSEYLTESRNRTETTASGSIKVGVRVSNTGLRTFTLSNLFVTVLQWTQSPDPASALGVGNFRTLATLQPEIESIVLAPGETSPPIEINSDDVDPGIIKAFLARPSSIVYSPAGFGLEDEDSIDFRFQTEQTIGRIATVVIDFGDGIIESYYVATNVHRNEQGDFTGVALVDVLSRLDIPFQTVSVDREVDDAAVQVSVLESVRDTSSEMPSDFGDPANGVPRPPVAFWAIQSDRDEHAALDLDFEDIVMQHGDEIRMAYVEDRDGDGLFAREEGSLGTSDDEEDSTGHGSADGFDTDDDGLSDFQEARVGWTVEITYEFTKSVSYKTYPDPRVADADGDGLADPDEKSIGTDPNNPDTDDDGLTDDVDPFPTTTARRLFVDASNDTPESGTTWDTAFNDLQAALETARTMNTDMDPANDVSAIWVAEGTYTPSPLGEQHKRFELLGNVAIYGGFGGIENKLGQRDSDPLTSLTILSGDLNGDDSGAIDLNNEKRGDNSCQVVYAGSDVSNAVLDGFAIVGGNAKSATCGLDKAQGGGLLNEGGEVLVRNMLFRANAAELGGGGLADRFNAGSVTCEDSVFELNRAGSFIRFCNDVDADTGVCIGYDNMSTSTGVGGAVLLRSGQLIGCRFSNNVAVAGGALAVLGDAVPGDPTWDQVPGADVRVTKCRFIDNSAIQMKGFVDADGNGFADFKPRHAARGGAIYADHGFDRLFLQECSFDRNAAGGQNADGWYANRGDVVDGKGGALYVESGPAALFELENALLFPEALIIGYEAHDGDVRIENCRFWSNMARGSFCPPSGGAITGGGIINHNYNLGAHCLPLLPCFPSDYHCGEERNDVAACESVCQNPGLACHNSCKQLPLDSAYQSHSATLSIVNSTFASNAIDHDDYAHDAEPSMVDLTGFANATVTNSIFWDNLGVSFMDTGGPNQGCPSCTFEPVGDMCGSTIPLESCIGRHNLAVNQLASVSFCAIQGLSQNPILPVTNINSDPKFMNAEAGDLRLGSDSPCIDTGDNFVDIDPATSGFQKLPETDLAGKPRIIDGDGDDEEVVDMGAYEHQGD